VIGKRLDRDCLDNIKVSNVKEKVQEETLMSVFDKKD